MTCASWWWWLALTNMHAMSLKVENKLKFVGKCPVHCLASMGVPGLYLCSSGSNHRRLSGPAPTALSPLSSSKLPFTLLNCLHHLSLLWVGCGEHVSPQPLLPVSALGTTVFQSAMSQLCREGWARFWQRPHCSRPSQAEPFPLYVFPCFISPLCSFAR